MKVNNKKRLLTNAFVREKRRGLKPTKKQQQLLKKLSKIKEKSENVVINPTIPLLDRQKAFRENYRFEDVEVGDIVKLAWNTKKGQCDRINYISLQ